MQDTIYGHSRQRNRVADKKSLGSIKHIYSYLPRVVLCIAKRWHKDLKLLAFFLSFFLFIFFAFYMQILSLSSLSQSLSF